MILFFYTSGGKVDSTSQSIVFDSMESCEHAKTAMTESVTQFKHIEQFHIGCYKK